MNSARRFNAEQASRFLRDGDVEEIQSLRAELERAPAPDASRLLNELASDPDPMVRDWAGYIGAQILAVPEAIAILRRLAEDRDTDVRTEALYKLVELDPAERERAVRGYRRLLASSRTWLDVAAPMWRLAQLRDQAAVPLIRQAAQRWQEPVVSRDAEAALMVLAGREDELCARLLRHDHVGVRTWLRAMYALGTPSARSCLERFIEITPDEECHRLAVHTLSKMRERVTDGALAPRSPRDGRSH